MNNLEKTRKEINNIDREMAKLFERRLDAAKIIAYHKKDAGIPIVDLNREDEVVSNNSKLIENKEYLPYYINFIKNNIKISKSYQSKIINGMQIAISGNKGAFADICASLVFPTAENIPFADFYSAYKSAQSGECDIAFLPIENSFGGDVGSVLDLAFFGDLYISGIYETEIVQNLVGVNDAKIEDVKTVASHPQALLQCSEFIESNGFSTFETANTTTALDMVKQKNDKSFAGIASDKAAENYGLKIIKSHINQQSQNTTRFAVFSRNMRENNDIDDRFVLMFTVKNNAGALSKSISVIGDYGYNLLDIKSRPTKLSNWNHYFYVEGEGNIFSDNGTKMIKELKSTCDNFKLVGSFRKEIKV